ncbi:MAG: hypothetical protein FJ091_06860 [Deltaproteobacteria bacterium]|nr:hypothetical protein [Deltaproteobacteria bacterium]
MLRITRCAGADGALSLRLEGRLAASDLPALASAVATHAPRAVALDLSELRALDNPARAWLEALIASGARVTAATPFIARLLGARG